jgi:gliding motility-associated-like protein
MYVRHTNSCEQIVNFNVEQFLPLQLVINDGNINEIVATATGGSGGYEYEVTNEFTSIVEPYGNTNTFTIYESANYTVTVTDSNGCVASATGYFEFIDVCITNYFTPNDDGNLDEWGPGCTNQYKDLTYDIFDRYGRKVATLKAGQKWDGRYNGIELPTGDYWYVVRLNDTKDQRNFVGHFTLYR